MMKIALAAMLAAAVASAPVVLEHCSTSCEAQRESVASSPSCHHGGSPAAAHLGHAPLPCGHDHNVTSVTTDTASAPVMRTFTTGIATLTILIGRAAKATPRIVRTHAPPGTPLQRFARSDSPLRV